MRTLILDDPYNGFNSHHKGLWLTTGDAARVLRVSREAVRKMIRAGRLACERSRRGLRLLREADVQQLAHERVDAQLVTVRPSIRRPRKGRGARQQPLFGVQLRMVKTVSPRRKWLTSVNRKAS
jgi:excisionase family DNA binding protein